MKQASYYYGVYWIAINDEPMDTNQDSVSGYISTLLLADLFHVSPEKVANDIVSLRTGKFTVRQMHAYERLGLSLDNLWPTRIINQ